MLKDEFDRLIAVFDKAAEGKSIDLREVIEQTLVFLQEFRDEFARASPEERKDLMQMMAGMNKAIMDESKKILKSSGMSEDQLTSFAENPSNYTPEQWKEFQESKSQIQKAGMEFYHQVQKLLPQSPIKPHIVQPIEKKEQPKTRKVHRSDWKPS